MPGNGLNFHPEARALSPHLRLAIRPHLHSPFCVRGDHEVLIGRYHATACAASNAIRAYCRRAVLTATVRIFTADAELWCEDKIAKDGKATRTFPPGEATGEEASLAADC